METMAESLLFIPDISGFTRFVNATEVEHGRHIVAELLELIIASDGLGMTVSEVEGDAVFFYREGPLPDCDALLAQARRTFEAFHTHLKSYETRRICDCGACSTAHALSLKFVAHAGPIDLLDVRGFTKPYGTDVIVTHRLLKNDIDTAEYLLLTEALVGDGTVAVPEWSELGRGTAELDDLGRVGYRYLSLASLKDRIPPPPEPPELERVARPIVAEGPIDREPTLLFELIANLDLRLQWNRGIDDLEYERERVNRVGTLHRCVIGGSPVAFETVTGDYGDGKRVYGERLLDSPFLRFLHIFYVVTPEGSGSHLRIEAHLAPQHFPRGLLAVPFRFRLGRILPKTLERIRAVAETGGGALSR